MSIIFVKKLFEPWGKVYFGNSPDVDRIRRILRGLHWGDLVSLAFLMFLSWTLIIMTGFLAVILARTILIRSRFAGLLAVILFFVIDFVVARVYDLICRIPFIATWTKIGALGWSLWDVVYFIAVCLILFGVSGLLAEKKLSV